MVQKGKSYARAGQLDDDVPQGMPPVHSSRAIGHRRDAENGNLHEEELEQENDVDDDRPPSFRREWTVRLLGAMLIGFGLFIFTYGLDGRQVTQSVKGAALMRSSAASSLPPLAPPSAPLPPTPSESPPPSAVPMPPSPLPLQPPAPAPPPPPPPEAAPPLYPSPPPPTPPSPPRTTACLSELSATGVQLGHSSRLWVYEGQGNVASLQKTGERPGTSPHWEETYCVSLLERADPRTCFDIRDGAALMHFGCTLLAPPWDATPRTVPIDGGATLHFTISPPPPPSPPAPPAPPALPLGSCTHPWCAEFRSWVDEHDSKFHRMWGRAWEFKDPSQGGCWDGLGGRDWLYRMYDGTWCDRNWMQGTANVPNEWDRPQFSAPAPALLGFDETILGYCSQLVGLGFDGGDLNAELADRCVRANKNVLRLLRGGRAWDMCQNIEWQLCALNGKLPGQDGNKISFASAPKDVQLTWWNDPSTHPTYTPRWDGYSLGDVYFAELCIIFTLCSNRARLFELEVGETMECEMDPEGFDHLVETFLLTA